MLVAGKSWKNGGGWFRQRPASASERQRASALRPHSDHRPQRNPVNPGSRPTRRTGDEGRLLHNSFLSILDAGCPIALRGAQWLHTASARLGAYSEAHSRAMLSPQRKPPRIGTKRDGLEFLGLAGLRVPRSSASFSGRLW